MQSSIPSRFLCSAVGAPWSSVGCGQGYSAIQSSYLVLLASRFRSDLVQINRLDLGSTLLTQEQEMFVQTPCLTTSQETQTPAVASSAPVLRDLTIPCGSSTNFFAAPLSKSRYPRGASSNGKTSTFTAFAIFTLSCRMAIISCRL